MAWSAASSNDNSLKKTTKEQLRATKQPENKETKVSKDPYKENGSAQVEQISEANEIQQREPTIRKEIAEASSMPAEVFKRICAVASVTASKNQNQSGNFDALDAKLTTSLGKVPYRELGQHKNVLEEAAHSQEKLGGGKTAWHTLTRSSEGVLLEHQRPLTVEKRDDSIRAYLTDWELVLCSTNEQSARYIQIEESPKQTLAL